MFFKEFLEVVGAGSQDTAVSPELDVLHNDSDVAVFSLQTLFVQQLQEDALMLIVHVLRCLRHLEQQYTQHNNILCTDYYYFLFLKNISRGFSTLID